MSTYDKHLEEIRDKSRFSYLTPKHQTSVIEAAKACAEITDNEVRERDEFFKSISFDGWLYEGEEKWLSPDGDEHKTTSELFDLYLRSRKI